ncbi:MAG: hypothetical protein ACP5N5_02655 [Desulfurococcus sp.]
MKNVIACVNLFMKHSRCVGPGVPVNASKPDTNPRGMQGDKDEGMTSV